MMKSEIITLFGKRGTGKTFASVWVANQLHRILKVPIYAINRVNDEAINNIVSPARRAAHFRGFVELLKKNTKKEQHAVYNVRDWQGARYFFDFFRRLEMPCILLIDEIDCYAGNNSVDPGLSDIINFGRHWGISVVGSARRSANVSKDLTAASHMIISFRQSERLDLDRMRNFTDNYELIKTLKNQHFIAFGDSGGALPEIKLDKIQKIAQNRVVMVNSK